MYVCRKMKRAIYPLSEERRKYGGGILSVFLIIFLAFWARRQEGMGSRPARFGRVHRTVH